MKKYILFFLTLTFLAGCGTSPEPDYYILTSVAGNQKDLITQAKIERPVLPEYLDRPDIVTLEGSDQVEIDEMKRWAAPLDEMLENVITEDLRQRLPSSVISSEQEGGAFAGRFAIKITIETLNSIDDNNVFKAQIRIIDQQGCKPNNIFSTEFNATAPGNREKALSTLVGLFSDTITDYLKIEGLNPPCTSSQ
jgi:uncharacterized lipoprotein YmbA